MNYKKLTKTAITPTRADAGAAGYDLYADITKETTIPPGQTVLIGTGIALEIPDGIFGGIFARSGLAIREGLRPGNCVGVIDPSYRGEIKVGLHNDSPVDRTITPGDRIAQIVFIPFFIPSSWTEVEDLSETARGEGGFGHTGKN